MRIELEERLGAKYPALFRRLRVDPMTSPMGRGIEVGDGWFELLDQFCLAVDTALAMRPDPDFQFEQIKQKFGELRVYATPTADARLALLLDMVRGESKTICEHCGAGGAELITNDGPWRIRCADCREVR